MIDFVGQVKDNESELQKVVLHTWRDTAVSLLR